MTNGDESTAAISGKGEPVEPPVVHLWRFPGKPIMAAVCGADSSSRPVRVTTMLAGTTCPECRRVAMEGR